MARTLEVPTSRAREINKKISNLRTANKDFDSLVSEIDLKMNQLISERNSSKSFNPKYSNELPIKITVNAVPLTADEKFDLLTYLRVKYIRYVKGDHFTLEKCLFSNKYRLYSVSSIPHYY